jgi:hypothetical protein
MTKNIAYLTTLSFLMTARIGWIDFSREHRDRVFSVIDMLGESGTVDELGIGVVRDALADWLFPGLSTIQTRPKYFLLIPRLIQDYVTAYKDDVKVPNLSQWLRDKEHELMHELAGNYDYEDNNGVIGINVARNDGELARRASSIYWNGIRTHGIVDTYYSLNDYLRMNDLVGMTKGRREGEERDDPDQFAELEGFGLQLQRFEQSAGPLRLDLSLSEAKFLSDQFRDDHGGRKKPENLLKQLMIVPDFAGYARDADRFSTFAGLLLADERLPEKTARLVQLALDFSVLIHAAHIRYNIYLHQQAGVTSFDEVWEDWYSEFAARKAHFAAFNIDFLFQVVAPQTKRFTQTFIRNWYHSLMQEQIDTARLDALVRSQEMINKGAKAKLATRSGEFSGWVGIGEINYRFPQARTIVRDIFNAASHVEL